VMTPPKSGILPAGGVGVRLTRSLVICIGRRMQITSLLLLHLYAYKGDAATPPIE